MKVHLHFSEILSLEMNRRGLKPSSLAREIGLSHVAVGNWLKAEKPSIPDAYQLLSLSRYFGVTIEWLLTGEDSSGTLSRNLSSPRVTEAEVKAAKKQIIEVLDRLLKKF